METSVYLRAILASCLLTMLLQPLGASTDALRYDTIERGRRTFTVMAGYGENHRIPSTAKQTFSFDVIKARYGWFTSPRSQYAVDLAYEKTGEEAENHALTGIYSYRRYLVMRGRTALALDVGLGGSWFSRKIPMLGTKINFTEIVGLTLERSIAPDKALTVEYRFSHTSNANTATPNIGVNASNIGVGLTWIR